MKKFFCFFLLLLPFATWAQCPVDGNFTPTSQAEVNAFSGCTALTGNLVIDGVADLTDVTALSGITTVDGYVQISNNTQLTDLTPLNITSVTGDVEIVSNYNLLNLPDNLTTIGGYLHIYDNLLLPNLSWLRNLVSIGTDLKIRENPLVPNMGGLEALASVGRNIEISQSVSLTSVREMYSIQVVNGYLSIHENPLLSSLELFIPLIKGDLRIYQMPSLANLNGLSYLKKITGELFVGNNSGLTSLQGLEQVLSVGSVLIGNNSVLSNLNALGNISITGNLIIAANPVLNTCVGFGVCAYLANNTTGMVYIDSNAEGCNSVAEIETACASLPQCPTGSISLSSQSNVNYFATAYAGCSTLPADLIIEGADITDLTPLSAITWVMGSFRILNNPLLANLGELENLVSVGGNSTSYGSNLEISGNPLLTNLEGLENLVTLVGAVEITANNSLVNLQGLEGLKTLNDYFQIMDNPVLTDLGGMENITAVSGVHLVRNATLVDLSALSPEAEIGTFTIHENPLLSNCSIYAICKWARIVDNEGEPISGNGPGCENLAGVISACEAMPVTLVDFVARKAETSVSIRWTTSSELNSSHFEVQHSVNKGQSWKILGEVQASKESFEAKQYDFTHVSPSKGENLYRLKMIDLDGTFAYSRIRNVSMDQVNAFYVYPNPVRNMLNVQGVSSGTTDKLQVYSSSGQILVSKQVTFSAKPYQLETSNLPAGNYIIHVVDKSGSKQVQKFVKLPH